MILQRLDLDATKTLTRYTMIVELSGVDYLFDFKWNRCRACWTFDLYVDNYDPICYGQTLIQDSDLLESVVHARKPPGTLFIAHVRGETILPDVETLGTECTLYYSDPNA